VLETLVKDRIGCKVRSIELSLPQRCAAHIASLTDISESVGVGMAGVKYATEGKTAVMATIDRMDSEEYSVSFGVKDIKGIANEIKRVPENYINAESNGVTEECISYLKPLIVGELSAEYENGLPKHIII
jgi:6-phosphofructokinase 1